MLAGNAQYNHYRSSSNNVRNIYMTEKKIGEKKNRYSKYWTTARDVQTG